ncbi:hypothetical protein GW17_00032443 [Ensete ventricosum]|nr:hypothetical protein GW17_00032443 [Ensete ventricosum]
MTKVCNTVSYRSVRSVCIGPIEDWYARYSSYLSVPCVDMLGTVRYVPYRQLIDMPVWYEIVNLVLCCLVGVQKVVHCYVLTLSSSVLQLRKMLDLLVHASQCRSPQCLYPNCRKVKGLFRHGIQCRTRASGGCVLCKKMWYLLQIHSRACKESECSVPRCRDLKEHLRRLQQQSDSRRRAAVMEMMRQRAAEVAASSG